MFWFCINQTFLQCFNLPLCLVRGRRPCTDACFGNRFRIWALCTQIPIQCSQFCVSVFQILWVCCWSACLGSSLILIIQEMPVSLLTSQRSYFISLKSRAPLHLCHLALPSAPKVLPLPRFLVSDLIGNLHCSVYQYTVLVTILLKDLFILVGQQLHAPCFTIHD